MMPIFRPLKVSLLLVALSSTALLRAADSDVEHLLSHMRASYAAVKYAFFVSESHFGATVYINTFTFESPSKIRLDITSPDSKDFKSSLIKISDGHTIAMKLPMSTQFTKQAYTLDNYIVNLPVNLESLCFFDSERQLSTQPGKNMEHSLLKIKKGEEWKGKKWTVLEETVNDQKQVVRYYIDPKTYFIWRTVVRPFGATEDYQDAQITKLDTSPKIKESAFETHAG